jgi:hypothetical protein
MCVKSLAFFFFYLKLFYETLFSCKNKYSEQNLQGIFFSTPCVMSCNKKKGLKGVIQCDVLHP